LTAPAAMVYNREGQAAINLRIYTGRVIMGANRVQPDFERLRKVLLRQGQPDRVPFVELFADREIMEAVIGEPIPASDPFQHDLQEIAGLRTIRFYKELGYDYVPAGPRLNMPRLRLAAADTADLPRQHRDWQVESTGVINSWQDFESFPWPQPNEIDYYPIEFAGRNLPDGMKVIAEGPGGQLENIMWLMGYMPMSYALADDPALVEAIAQKVGEMLVTICTTAAQIPGVGALWLGDDMGFNTSTMFSPSIMRRYVFPYQKKLAAIAHAHNMPFLLHSCGNLAGIMDDLIDDVKIDAKHSFEDAIQPVAAAKKQYGQRVALLGGIDMDVLCRYDEAHVRTYTRRVIEACAPGGGWALGTGNTVANYIPLKNYLAMLDEGRNFRF
jgi:uroporphyrinogen decarboxylase